MEEKPFDELSRGEQYLRLLRIEYEDLLKSARFISSTLRNSVDMYRYTYLEIEAKKLEIALYDRDIAHYKDVLAGIGAENEEPLTEAIVSESPKVQFTGVSCTTVY